MKYLKALDIYIWPKDYILVNFIKANDNHKKKKIDQSHPLLEKQFL